MRKFYAIILGLLVLNYLTMPSQSAVYIGQGKFTNFSTHVMSLFGTKLDLHPANITAANSSNIALYNSTQTSGVVVSASNNVDISATGNISLNANGTLTGQGFNFGLLNTSPACGNGKFVLADAGTPTTLKCSNSSGFVTVASGTVSYDANTYKTTGAFNNFSTSDQLKLNAKQGLLSGSGFVKGGTPVTYDTSTYSTTAHVHGNITAGGAIGSTATLPVITGTSGVLQAGSFGTTAGTFAQGNDGRFTDTRNTTNALTITTGNGLNGTAASFNGSAAVTVSHLNTDGNLHVPVTSTTNNGKVLTAGASAGSLSWVTPTYMVYPGAGVPVSTGAAWGTSLNITAISDSTSTTSSTTAASSTAVKSAYDLASTNGLPSQTGNNGKWLTTNGSAASWGTLTGGGDMAAATYDPAAIAQQIVGTTATQTVSNKNLIATSESVTCADTGTALSTTIKVSAISSDGDGDLDNCTLANGTTAGQEKEISVTASGSAGSTLKITPATAFVGGAATYEFGTNDRMVGKGINLVWNGSAWAITSERNPSPQNTANYSTGTQSITTARTYVTGSYVKAPVGGWKAGTIIRWTINISKTDTVGTAAPVIDVAIGTAGTTSDTARVSFTGLAQTAAADTGAQLQVTMTFRAVGATTTAVAAGSMSMISALTPTTGLKTYAKTNTSAGFDSTTAGIGAGICVTMGTSAALTVNQVIVEQLNI